MTADVLAPYIARTPAAMILTMQNGKVFILFEEEFRPPVSYQCGAKT